MHRFLLVAAGFLAVSASSLAQQPGGIALPIVNPRDAGTYHLATGTWSRTGAAVRAWNDVLFDNTCSSGFYLPVISSNRLVEDGRIPSSTSPTNPGPPASAISWTGTQDNYVVTYLELGYCTFTPLPTLEINFWDCFTGCADATLITPTATLLLNSMPGAPPGAGACWVAGVNLANSGSSFTINADCDGVWDGGGGPDTFGWSWRQVSPSVGGTAGPFIAGDPLGYLNGGPGSSGCEFGANTVFYTGASPATEGTGLDGLDQWEEDVVTPTPAYLGCFWLGGYYNGNYYGSFHLQVGGQTSGPCCTGHQYCPGDGIATPCPYANNNDGSASPGGGCHWGNPAFASGGILQAYGNADHAVPDVMLLATAVENNFGIFFGGNNQTNGGAGNPLNDGLRCAGGGLVRLTPPTMASANTASHGPVELSDTAAGPGLTRYYQYWFRTPNGPGLGLANLTNGYAISWM